LCDSLFPIGGFAYSDGLEAAAASHEIDLRDWLDVCLEETIARLDGPAVWRAWAAFASADWDALVSLDQEVAALRPSSTTRRSIRAMGLRLVTAWHALHPDPRLACALALAARGCMAPTLPVAFAGACACAGIERRQAVEGFAYTRLASTVSAAMRLMPVGQTAAHAELAHALKRLPAVVDRIVTSHDTIACFTPAMDLAAMRQQYLHSRLFRS